MLPGMWNLLVARPTENPVRKAKRAIPQLGSNIESGLNPENERIKNSPGRKLSFERNQDNPERNWGHSQLALY